MTPAQHLWRAIGRLAATETEEFKARSIGGRSPSLKWPHLYDILRAKGYSKEKSARISNAKIGGRKQGRLRGLSREDVTKFNEGKLSKRKLANLTKRHR